MYHFLKEEFVVYDFAILTAIKSEKHVIYYFM